MFLRKIDAIIIVALLVVTTIFLYKAGYVSSFFPSGQSPPSGDPGNTTTVPMTLPTPSTSLIPSYRREVTAADEGVHFDDLQVSREWWYFNAVFNDSKSELRDWAVAVSFNHMARGDLFGTNKPDLLVVSLLGNGSQTYGGMINKQHYLGILKEGTLIAGSPGVKVQFEDSWAEGAYPDWHVHAESQEIDTTHQIIIDLQYHALSLPLWTFGPRAFDQSDCEIANYVILGCVVTGSVTIDGAVFHVKGTGSHDHSWTPHLITKASLNGWDWFTFTLDNGWDIYVSNYLPTPQVIPDSLSRRDPFSTFLLTPDCGSTITELKGITLTITQKDEKVFPLVKMPSGFSLTATPSLDPMYVISQSSLVGSEISLSNDIVVTHSTNKIWRFPTYVGMKVGYCTISGTLSWTDETGPHEVPLQGVGVSWSMRALL
jgi:hypothetical protein